MKQLSDETGIPDYVVTSAKTGEGVDDLLEKIAELVQKPTVVVTPTPGLELGQRTETRPCC
jgi:translation initiation factor IF-2